MNKTWLIIKREYLTRVRKKTFILSTILTPLLFVGIFAAVTFITIKNLGTEKIAVVDPHDFFQKNLESVEAVTFELSTSVDTSNFDKNGYTGILYPPHTGFNTTDSIKLITSKSFGMASSEGVQRQINRALENNFISRELNINPKEIDSIKDRAREVPYADMIKGEGEKLSRGNSGVAYGVGYASGFLIYITLFIYGAMVMRGVMEEKTNRIAEVIVSSVRPFQLMMGKIIGIGAVGLTQFLMWIILITILSTILGSLISPEVMAQVQHAQNGMPGASQQGSEALRALAGAKLELSTVNWGLIIFCFLFYFIGGYLFYAALFAAVGSTVNEDPQDAQSLMLPITMPIILAIVIMINAITNPTSSLATWSSIIPFFSPIVMMARIPFGVPGTVPWWQLGLSMALLVAGFLFTTWLAAKIYRTGILLYGKKATWKEMFKWIRRS